MSVEITGREKVGHVAAELMEIVELSELPDDVGGATIETVAVIAEVRFDHTDPDEPGFTTLFYHASDPRRWVHRGLFAEAIRSTDYND